MEEDFSEVVAKVTEEATTLVEKGGSQNLAAAIEKLLTVEKQTRNAGDVDSTVKVAACIVQLCFKARDFDALVQNLLMLSKRRGQMKQVVKAFVSEAMQVVNQLDDEAEADTKVNLITRLRSITEGKLHVEEHHAKLTSMLASLAEKKGNIKEAASILQEVQVETYGSLDKRSKTEFLLEQMRLCLDSDDFIRGQIISRKINTKILLEQDFQDLKLKFYNLMIRYHLNSSNYLEVCRAYQSIYNTPKVQEDKEAWKRVRMIDENHSQHIRS